MRLARSDFRPKLDLKRWENSAVSGVIPTSISLKGSKDIHFELKLEHFFKEECGVKNTYHEALNNIKGVHGCGYVTWNVFVTAN